MNIVYLHKMICEELDGAREYIMEAKKIQKDYPAFSKTFVEMSKAELSHAENLFKMAETMIEEMKSSSPESSEFIDNCYHIIIDDYEERYSMVTNLHSHFKG